VNGRCRAVSFSGWMHELVEILVAQRMRAARADKIAVEIDVIADDALDRAIRRAVEDGIEAVSKVR
jgi:hypothetical protein